MKTEQEVQNFIAKEYPKRYSGTGFLYHSRLVTDMLQGAKFKDGRTSDKILDVGCGIGFVSQLYPNFDIVGIDISDEMLKRNPFKWHKAPAEAIPFPDNHFDYVVCRSLLHHLENPVAGLREMFRVLKPGGTWVAWDPNQNLLANLFRKLFQHTDRFSHLHKSFNDQELIGMVKSIGFTVTEAKYIGFLAYPLLGFPDIVNFNIPLGLGKLIMRVDELLSNTLLKRWAWSLRIKAIKQ